jgi:hypothetical protein
MPRFSLKTLLLVVFFVAALSMTIMSEIRNYLKRQDLEPISEAALQLLSFSRNELIRLDLVGKPIVDFPFITELGRHTKMGSREIDELKRVYLRVDDKNFDKVWLNRISNKLPLHAFSLDLGYDHHAEVHRYFQVYVQSGFIVHTMEDTLILH